MLVHIFNTDGEEIARFTAVGAVLQDTGRHPFDADLALDQLAKHAPQQAIAVMVDRNPFDNSRHPKGHKVVAGDHAVGAESR